MLPIHINPSSGVPIYRQIMNQVHSLIGGGALGKDDRLPSVRELGAFLQVNPMTVSKAYSLLEVEKTVYRVRGKGVYVSSLGSPLKKKERLEMLEDLLSQVVYEARRLDILPEEALRILQKRLLSTREESKK